MTRKLILAFALPVFLAPAFARAEEPVDLSMMTRIRDEGLHHSQVMDTVFHITDVIGPRLTASPQLKEANEWTRKQFEAWGLANAHLEGYPFGRGWEWEGCQVRMVSPRAAVLTAVPKAWTPGTNGPLRGEVMKAKITEEKDLEEYRGKVAGKILLVDEAKEFKQPEDAQFSRYSQEDLEKLSGFNTDAEERDWRAGAIKRWKLRRAINEFLEKEKVAAVIETSGRVNGVVRVTSGGSWEPGESVGVPALVMMAEHYNQLLRLVDEGGKVELEIDVPARFLDGDGKAYNTVAEIPGTDKKDEIVMAGAHLDSWHAGTGATDNAAGSAVVMEAARILKSLGVKPRRTIRFVLWTGEEQGYYGSLAYVKQHFATRPETRDPEQLKIPERYRVDTWPLQLKPEHAKLAAYFNLDNGTGRILGIWGQGNAGAMKQFDQWGQAVKDLGWKNVSPRSVGQTDHGSFENAGLPGFQFIQERLEYNSRTHHSNMDTFDHVQKDDVIQQGAIAAVFAWHAANTPDRLPRKPLPAGPQ